MADAGNINEAENQLLDCEDNASSQFLRESMAFYEHINEYDDEFLEEHNYTRQEIIDGLRGLLSVYGLSDMMDLIKQE